MKKHEISSNPAKEYYIRPLTERPAVGNRKGKPTVFHPPTVDVWRRYMNTGDSSVLNSQGIVKEQIEQFKQFGTYAEWKAMFKQWDEVGVPYYPAPKPKVARKVSFKLPDYKNAPSYIKKQLTKYNNLS
jgi:hypothetical protein